MSTENILTERKKTHGEYAEHAACTQAIMRVFMSQPNWPTLSDMQKETMHMIAHKSGRILTGNPDIADHYDDIAGYATLISQRLGRDIPVRTTETDYVMAFALAWNIPVEEARAKLHSILDKRRGITRTPVPEPVAPGSPEDGGQHENLEKSMGISI